MDFYQPREQAGFILYGTNDHLQYLIEKTLNIIVPTDICRLQKDVCYDGIAGHLKSTARFFQLSILRHN